MEVLGFRGRTKSVISKELTTINVTDLGPWALQIIEIDWGQVEIPGKTFIGAHAWAQERQHKGRSPSGWLHEQRPGKIFKEAKVGKENT